MDQSYDTQAHVVRVIKLEKHPGANKLSIATISDGEKTHTVVCGAQNIRENMLTIFAPVGTLLPGLTAPLAAAELRGVMSYGMLCSAKDLGVTQEKGLVDLPESLKAGTLLKEIPKHQLTSQKWDDYKEVESFWKEIGGQKITVLRGDEVRKNLPGHWLISRTYFHKGRYYYRQFNS
jgi:tRNA-binding EMAP/Myf-like protein